MSSQERGPAYPLSLIAGALILLGGLVRAASIGFLPPRAYGMGYRFVSGLLRTTSFGVGPAFNLVSAVIGIISGVIVLFGAVMLSSHLDRNASWGTVILIFSAAGLLGGGGFLVGSLLGILGGILAITWRPVTRSL